MSCIVEDIVEKVCSTKEKCAKEIYSNEYSTLYEKMRLVFSPIQFSIDVQNSFFEGATANRKRISKMNQELPRENRSNHSLLFMSTASMKRAPDMRLLLCFFLKRKGLMSYRSIRSHRNRRRYPSVPNCEPVFVRSRYQ